MFDEFGLGGHVLDVSDAIHLVRANKSRVLIKLGPKPPKITTKATGKHREKSPKFRRTLLSPPLEEPNNKE